MFRRKKLILLLVLTSFALASIVSAKPRYFYRHYTDANCISHEVQIRVDDNGEEEVIYDAELGRTSPCDGERE